MKTILGLDLGTNSIGWAVIQQDIENKQGEILGLGSRIIPMSQAILGKFDSGVSISQTAERTGYRGVRRLRQRHLLRRERLHRVLNILNFLPNHYKENIDFSKNFGKFKEENEIKLVYKPILKENKTTYEFIFQNSFNEMVNDFKNNGLENTKIPYDWTIYYLRKKALTQKIEKEELAWILLNFNQKRGYYQLRGEEQEIQSKKEFVCELQINEIEEGEIDKKSTKVEKKWYHFTLENGWVYSATFKDKPEWVGLKKEFLITEEYDEIGNIKITKENKKDENGKEKRTIVILPSFEEIDAMSQKDKDKIYKKIKAKTERVIIDSKKSVGTFIYDTLLKNPSQKINGKLVRTIERKFYKEELEQIVTTQMQFHDELRNQDLYLQCINDLYKQNEAHKNNIKNRNFKYLFLDDIIFYQRPLKSKKSEILDCTLEFRNYEKDGELHIQTIKCIAKSNPLFQEFRLWQWIKNIKILKIDHKENIDITHEFLKSEEDYVTLFDNLNDKKEITQKQFLTIYKLKESTHRWNYVEDKTYPCNETRAVFIAKSSKIEGFDKVFFNKENSEALWHILYSVTNKEEIEKAIKKFSKKQKPQLGEEFVTQFSNIPPYKSDYGSFSEKAIKKLLPLMRMGKYWDEKNIDPKTRNRIEKIIDGEFDENIKNRVREKAINLTEINHFKGLPLWLASYIVYDKHSEAKDLEKWNSPNDITEYLDPKNKNGFKQHSLRNPIVEQVITETLRTVKDIWEQFGDFSEIHVELGREMKNSAEKRKKLTKNISTNENTNLRIKAILEELKNNGNNDVRPYSPSQQEILKIYEEGIYSNENQKEELDTINKIRKNNNPSQAEITKYKLWLEQGYISPYTGATIKLSDLFKPKEESKKKNNFFENKYEIEHIFPQSRFFDDSLNNKIICESEVNTLKDNQTAMEFIKKHGGDKVTLSDGKVVTIKEVADYEEHIKRYFVKNKQKMKNLLSEDIPEDFINRQLNDSRYIAKVVKTYLSKIVREEKNGELEQEATSKNVVSVTGSITSKMKQDWGLNDVWNHLITPRFERLNKLTNSSDYGKWELKESKNGGEGKQVFQTMVPDAIAKGFSKKRIDHRHHALDALVIACITKEHINYLNSINSERKNYSLVSKLRKMEDEKIKGEMRKIPKEFYKPWETFTQDATQQLKKTIISFKQNKRIINKTVNKYERFIDGKKVITTQTKGDNWAIRKPLHKETVSGKVILKRIKENLVPLNNVLENFDLIVDLNIKKQLKERAVHYKNNISGLKKYLKTNPIKIDDKIIDKIQVYEYINATATRKTLDINFDEKQIKKITDTGIQKILLNHLKQDIYQNIKDDKRKEIPPHEIAFSQEGLETMNKNITQLNDGKSHKPIYKVREYTKYTEDEGKFPVGNKGNRTTKYVVAAKGTNLFFAIYTDENGKRSYKTIPLNEAIECQKQGLNIASEVYEKENKLLFILSPNDLVYIPSKDEIENHDLVDFENLNKEQVGRVYKFVDSSGDTANFIPAYSATTIFSMNKKDQKKSNIEYPIQDEYGLGSPQSKNQNSIEGMQVKSICWKLEINRLGQITKVFMNNNKIINVNPQKLQNI